MRPIRILLFILSLFVASSFFAQRHANHRHRHPHRKVVVKRSVYRPAKVVVFHPRWRPGVAYHRRWVFFPRYNLYWDNWRNHYVFWNGTVWISQTTPPPAVSDADLEKEKHRELPESEDDVDDVYKSNDSHKEESTIK